MPRPLSIDFADIARRNEGLYVVLLYELHQVGELGLGDQSLNLLGRLVGIASCHVVDGTSPGQFIDDETP